MGLAFPSPGNAWGSCHRSGGSFEEPGHFGDADADGCLASVGSCWRLAWEWWQVLVAQQEEQGCQPVSGGLAGAQQHMGSWLPGEWSLDGGLSAGSWPCEGLAGDEGRSCCVESEVTDWECFVVSGVAIALG